MKTAVVKANIQEDTSRNAHWYWAMWGASLWPMLCAFAVSHAANPSPVPGYVPPVTLTIAPEYADDTRGVFVPSHEQYRKMTPLELQSWGTGQVVTSTMQQDHHEQNLNRLANGAGNMQAELNRIAGDPGRLKGGQGTQDAMQYAPLQGQQLAQGFAPGELPAGMQPQPIQTPPPHNYQPAPMPNAVMPSGQPVQVHTADGGVEIAIGDLGANQLDIHNSLVRLREDRITVRRALQRMMDQIGGSAWNVVWDLSEQNAGLAEMEISIYAEEPFINVMNALLARMQTRAGQPLRVIKYDQSRRLVITDRTGGYQLSGQTNPFGITEPENVVVSERVLRDTMVSLHYDEIPLVDALENIIAQAGKGQWRLRMYAGRDQVLKPAHIEEPLHIALERLLKLFNLKYEIFPGGKLIVVTHASRFGYGNMGQ